MPLITGTSGADTLQGGSGNDTLRGLAGHDRLLPGDGADLVEGGEGNDEINGYLTDPGSGRYGFSYFVVSGAKTLRGGQGDDVIIGGSSGDSLLGEDGQDFLAGLEGDDTLDGGAGINRLDGGPGNDLYRIRSIDTEIVDEGGTDTLEVGISHAKVPSWIEKITHVDGAQPLPYWIDALLPDSASGRAFTQLLDASRTLRYAFPATLPAYNTDAEDAKGYAPFTAVQQERAVAALQGLSAILNLQFAAATDVAATGVLAFANNQQQGSAGYAVFPNRSSRGSDLFFDIDGRSNDRFASGTYAALVLIHEIAHALGLEHPFAAPESDGDRASPPHLGPEEDRTTWTVMSYEDTPAEYELSLRALDIAALQYLYGPSPRAHTGADVYTVNPLEPNFIWDGAGVDTLDASALSVPVVLSLEPGFWGYVGSARGALITQPGQVTVNFGSVIERVVGGAGADDLRGNAGANTLTGGPGNDTLDGGAGEDMAVFSGMRQGYTLVWSASTSTLTVTSASEGRDTLYGIEVLLFADSVVFTSSLQGNSAATAPTLSAVSPLAGATEDTAFTITYAALAAAADEADAQGDALAFRVESVAGGTLSRNGVAVVPGVTRLAAGEQWVWTPPADANGSLPAFTVRVVDAAQSSAREVPVNVLVAAVNDAPVWIRTLTDPSAVAGRALSFSFAADAFRDVDSATLSYSASRSDGGALPAWLSFNPNSRSFSGTPGAADAGVLKIRLTASDGSLSTDTTIALAVAAVAGQNITGTAAADVLSTTAGHDRVDGLAGVDRVVYSGAVGQYSIRIDRAAQTVTVTDSQPNRSGRDTLIHVEQLQFGSQIFELFNPPRTEAPRYAQARSFLFDEAYYLLSNPELLPTVTLQTAAQHYLSTGAAQGRRPNMWFDPVYYANRWADLKALNATAETLFQHYNLFGVWEGRSAGPMFDRFDGNRYLTDNPDVAAYVDATVSDFLGSRSNGAMAHYLIYGAAEGRAAYDLSGALLEAAVLVGV